MRLPALFIVLLYAAFSTLWIAVAGYLISLAIDDPTVRSRALLAREFVLVAVSSGLFYLLLRSGRDTAVPSTLQDPDPGGFRSRRLALMLVSLAMVAPLAGIGIVNVYGPEMERKAYGDLRTIVDLKAEQAELWLAERRGDAEAIAASKALIEWVADMQHETDGRLRQLISNRLDSLQKAYGYESMLLLDTDGQLLIESGEQHELSSVTEKLLPVALRTRQIQSSDLFVDEGGKAWLDVVVPLIPEAITQQAIAIVILRVNLDRFLIPMIEKWPGNNPSGEILLVSRSHETITYLNKRHLLEDTGSGSGSLIISKDLAAEIAVREGTRGTTYGTDYRGEPVFAAYRPIVGSGLHLIAKIDRGEVRTQLWTLVLWVSVVVLFAIAAVSLLLLLLWRHEMRAHQLAILARTVERDRLLNYFYELPFIGMAITSPDNKRWLRFNNRLCEILGYSRDELAQKNWLEMTHPEDVKKDVVEFEQVLRGESEGYAMNKRFIRKDGSIVVASIDVKCVRYDNGGVHYFVAMLRDITEQERQKSEILAARSQLQATLEAIPDLLLELDLDGQCYAYHSGRTHLVPPSVGNLVGKKISDALPASAGTIIMSALLETQEKGLSTGRQLELELPQGGFWYELSVSRKDIDVGMAHRFIVLARDITERKAAERRILNLAHYDGLTGLPNRALLADRMKVAIKRAAREFARLAVLFVDLDRFKPINDSLGHEIGDHLLKAVAERMQTAVRSVDTVSRVGGDEFVVLLSEIETGEDAARVAEKLIFGLSQPYRIEGHELLLTASIGICIYPDNGTEPGILLRNADASMYAAKEAGRNRYQFYSEEMTARAIQRLDMERDLRRALGRGEMFLVYQPQIELATGTVVGVEVFMRWRHSRRGLISPRDFIPVAEDTGLILPMGDWTLLESCRQARQWRERDLLGASISVNVSAVQFRQTDFVEVVERALADSGLPSDGLELELTESVAMQGVESAFEKLRRLDMLGVKVAIDDFGTGYSSLSYLRQFSVGRLKIDQSFVRDLPGNIDAEAIATAIVAMGLSLGLRIIAEGIETEAQAEFLQSILCQEGQGYLYASPMTASEFETWVAARRPLHG